MNLYRMDDVSKPADVDLHPILTLLLHIRIDAV